MAVSDHGAGSERFFSETDVIVSKTDLTGKITYGNRIFFDIAGYTEVECLGKPHSMIRHPDMPRTVFGLLWETIMDGREVFAYVKNRAKNGDFYWVLAHVTPSYDPAGGLIGYHSNRRVPDRRIVDNAVIPLYRNLLREEQRHGNKRDGVRAGLEMLNKALSEKGVTYDEFVHTL